VREYGRTLPYLVFIGCCLIWGSTFLAIRIGNEAVAPVWAATIRLALAAPLGWIRSGRPAAGYLRIERLRRRKRLDVVQHG